MPTHSARICDAPLRQAAAGPAGRGLTPISAALASAPSGAPSGADVRRDTTNYEPSDSDTDNQQINLATPDENNASQLNEAKPEDTTRRW